eukprot:1177656-Prorocentrum_minimum.AAC.2
MLDPLVQCYFSRGLHWQRTSTLSTHKITRQNNRSGRLKGAPLRAHTLEAWCPRLGVPNMLPRAQTTCVRTCATTASTKHLAPWKSSGALPSERDSPRRLRAGPRS